MRMATAYMHNFEESEVVEAIKIVEETFCIDRSSRQFEAVLACVCRLLASHANRYGPYGSSEIEVGSRSSFKYWFDEIPIEQLVKYVEQHAKMPPDLMVEIVAKTNQKCASCKGKPEPGEVRAVAFGDWKPNGMDLDGSIVGFRKDKHYCLAADCLANLTPAMKAGVAFHDAMPPETRAVVATAFGANAGTPKPSERFKKLRKRPRDEEDEDRFEFSDEAKAKIAAMAIKQGEKS